MNHRGSDGWDTRHQQYDAKPTAASVLAENTHLLPAQGRALDLACGRGGNALLLAQQGLTTEAWDFSKVALEKLTVYAQSQKLEIKTCCRDVVMDPPAPNEFDIIVVSNFLERQLLPALTAALRPDGLLFYETFTAEKTDSRGPNNSDYLLRPNELLTLCQPLRLIYYREDGRTGKLDQGCRNKARYIGRKV
ncbi:MAG: methyltransferase domain-containing protein [Gammaproteobacteria bacterium]